VEFPGESEVGEVSIDKLIGLLEDVAKVFMSEGQFAAFKQFLERRKKDAHHIHVEGPELLRFLLFDLGMPEYKAKKMLEKAGFPDRLLSAWFNIIKRLPVMRDRVAAFRIEGLEEEEGEGEA